MRCLLFICLVMLLDRPLCAEELRLITDTSDTWVTLKVPQPPATDMEKLALRASVAGTTVSQESLTAYYLDQKNNLDLIRVEEAPESDTERFHSVVSYQIRDGRIWGHTRLKYVSKPNPENEQVAREIARDYLLGRGDQIPVLFNGRAYVVQYDGKCLLTVIEKDDTMVHFTYRYSRCR